MKKAIQYLNCFSFGTCLLWMLSCGNKPKENIRPEIQPTDTITPKVETIDSAKKSNPHINWNSNCTGTFKNKNGILKIWNYQPNNDTIQFKLETAGEELCTGEIEGFAVINGEQAQFDKWYETEYCGVYFKYDGKNTIKIKEEINCLAYHGQDCPFAGTYKKK